MYTKNKHDFMTVQMVGLVFVSWLQLVLFPTKKRGERERNCIILALQVQIPYCAIFIEVWGQFIQPGGLNLKIKGKDDREF